MKQCGDLTARVTVILSWNISGKSGRSWLLVRFTVILIQFGGVWLSVERLKNMELKKTFLVLSASCVLVALLMLGLVFMICNSISSNFPSGGIEILADGSIVKMETPTETQQNILSMLGIIQIVSCIVLPMGGLALSGILYYHIKLKQPISTLRNGISRIRNHDLDFSMPVHSDDELGQLCTAFDTMREELLKSNQELWRQAEKNGKG